MRRSDFWYRVLPLNVIYNIATRCIDNYYSAQIESNMGSLIKEVETAGENVSDQLIGDYMGQIYSYFLPLVGLILLVDIIYYVITAPWYVKRFHDVGMSGGWLSVSIIATLFYALCLLISPIIPFAMILGLVVNTASAIFIIICCGLKDSQYAANRYGESPKYGRYKLSKLPTIPKED